MGPYTPVLHTLLFSTVTRIYQGGEFVLAVGIKVRDKESIDRALRRFKRTVNRSRVLRIYRQNMSYTKPSEERRLARKKARRRRRSGRRKRY